MLPLRREPRFSSSGASATERMSAQRVIRGEHLSINRACNNLSHLAMDGTLMRIFITGGTGLIGTTLIRKLHERKDQPVVLSRRAAQARALLGAQAEVIEGDPMQAGSWLDALQQCDAVINLAGENIFARRWNDAFKEQLRASRLQSTSNVVAALARNPRTASGAPKVLVSASAIGYYGAHGDEELTEESPPARDFMGTLCVDWEQAALQAQAHGVRVALVRIGVVLDKRGGALAQLLTPFKLGVGGPAGSGKQWMSWIHHADLVGLLLFALDNPEVRGPLNGTAPMPMTNRDFSSALGRVLHRPAFMPVPGFALKLRFGEVADVVLNGQRVLPRKALALGYKFQYPDVESALQDAVK